MVRYCPRVSVVLGDVIDIGESAWWFAATGLISRLRDWARRRTRCGATFRNERWSKPWSNAIASISLEGGQVPSRADDHPPNAAGIDIGSASHFVAVPPDRDDDAGARVRQLHGRPQRHRRLGCTACGVDTVAMEATGVYWIALFEILEERGFEVYLVNRAI